jgi:SAM-dependent methyltransferase
LSSDFIFDQEHARRFVAARQVFLRPILADLRVKLQLASAADVGCGVGYFSGFLSELGFAVTAFDGRIENVEEARRRYPEVVFQHANVEDSFMAESEPCDLVLCVGLLYHLENPIRALRNLSRMSRKLLLIESYATPQKETALYLRQEADFEDQSLTSLALYPSESTLIKICYRLGFPAIYRFTRLPDHEDFRDRNGRKRQRTVLLASRTPLDCEYLRFVAEPQDFSDPWQTIGGRILSFVSGARRRIGMSVAGGRTATAPVVRAKNQ